MANSMALSGPWNVPVGAQVVDVERARVGEVVGYEGDRLVIDAGGLLFQHEAAIPTRYVHGYQDGVLYLSVSKDKALADDGEDPPSGLAADAFGFAGSPA